MDEKAWNLGPGQIEARSMEIIDTQVGAHSWPPEAWQVVRRMIHTTADFDWARITLIHPEAIERGVRALRRGCTIFTDTQMARMGISAWRLAPLGARVRCLMAEEEVKARAAAEGTTRAVAAMDLAVQMDPEALFVVGNAPTALLRLVQHAEAGRARPALVVGLPVGFVNAAEAKETLAHSRLCHITAQGPKGGSAVAASAVNALAILAGEERS